MAIGDYLSYLNPTNYNVFGVENPAYTGLLGDQAAGLKRSSNIAGLLGAAAALAQGVSGQGARRSAAQNIIGALGAGYGSAGQAYQQGLQNFGQTQQLMLQQRQQAGVQAMKMKYPDLADEFDTNPAGAFRIVAEREAATRKPTVVSEGGTLVSPTGEVLYSSTKNKPQARMLSAAEVLEQQLPTGAGQKYQVDATGKISPIEGTLPSKENKPATSIEEYQFYKSQGGTKSYGDFIQGKTPSTTVNVAPSDKKFAESFGTATAGAVENTFNKAQSAQNTLSTIATIKPLIKGDVFAGPLSSSEATISRLGAKFGITSGTTQEKLNATTQAMQGLASLELTAAEAMKGQGAITDFERTLIARAAGGDLAKLTQKEVLGLLDALEKVSQKKIDTHKTNLVRLRKRPDTSALADFYELDAPKPKLKFNPDTGKVE
jgi:hypothetical protein